MELIIFVMDVILFRANDNFSIERMFHLAFDQNGDLDRESFIVKVVNGHSQVVETLKPAAN